jgi:Na+-driven multidrug efflux pump
VGLSNSIASTTLLLYASASVGAGVMVARAFGRKDLGEVSRITAAGEALAGGLGLLTALLLRVEKITSDSEADRYIK